MGDSARRAHGIVTSELSRVPEFALLFRRLMREQVPAVLDSAGGPPHLARRSIFAFGPFQVLVHSGGRSTLIDPGGGGRTAADNPFTALREELSRYRLPVSQGCHEGMPGGAAIGFLGYELGRYVERLPATAERDIGIPDMYWAFYDSLLVVDHALGTACVVASDVAGRDPSEQVRRWQHVLDEAVAAKSPGGGESGLASPLTFESLRCNFTRDEYCRAVQRSIDYIAAGDIFQVNLSQRFTAPLACSADELYLRLRRSNPAPFAAYVAGGRARPRLDSIEGRHAVPLRDSRPRHAVALQEQTQILGGSWAVLSSSPELFLRVRGRRVATRPIKGTRPHRGRSSADDVAAEAFNARSRAELLSSAKDAAELAMIVDLERNDLGRVCSYGSVRVTERRTLEEYASVYHTVAQVAGELHEDRDLVDLLKATFPGGSITGAPKVRAMEIIDELEPTCRSVYTGAIGMIGLDGSMDLNIAIRTLLVDEDRVHLQVGGGIVADSTPECEYDETLHKARSMLEALGIAMAVTQAT